MLDHKINPRQVPDDVLLTFGGDQDAVIVLDTTSRAADAEVTGYIEGTSDHQGYAAKTLVISNINNDGDIVVLVSDAGNSKEAILVNADVADLQLGHGMATATVKTASGALTLAPTGDIILSPSGITQDYAFTDRGNALALQSQTSGGSFDFGLYTQDGDGTDAIFLNIWYLGTPGSITSRERIQFGFASDVAYINVDAAGSGTARNFEIRNDGTAWFTLTAAGGMQMGSPTGGDKGAGTINAVAVYDDNAILTDYVFEEDYDLLPISEMVDFFKHNLHLPTIPGRDEWETNGKPSLGKLITQLWETVEVQARYIGEIEGRLNLIGA